MINWSVNYQMIDYNLQIIKCRYDLRIDLHVHLDLHTDKIIIIIS